MTKQEQIKYIHQCLDRLNEEENVILTLFYLQENSIQEICEITGYTESNEKVKLHRARKTFYDELQFILKDEVMKNSVEELLKTPKIEVQLKFHETGIISDMIVE